MSAGGVIFRLPVVEEAIILAASRQPGGGVSNVNAIWADAGATIVHRTTVYTTLASSSTRSQIQTALDDCPSGQVVELGAGTFTVAGALLVPSDVTLRGQGPSTILNFTSDSSSDWYWAGGSCPFYFGGSSEGYTDADPAVTGPSQAAVVFSGTGGQSDVYTQGATTLNVGSWPSGLSVGDTIAVNQSNEPNGNLPMSGWFVSSKTGSGSSAICREGSYDASLGGDPIQRMVVQTINQAGLSLTVDPPFMFATGIFQSGLSPKLWRYPTSDMTENAGIEDLWIRTTSLSDEHTSCGFMRARHCWVRGVVLEPDFTSFQAGNATDNGFGLYDSHHCTIRDSWVMKMIGGGPNTTTSYGVTFKSSSSCLVENNIFDNVESPIMITVSSCGNVVAYNYERYVGDDGQEAGFSIHEPGALYNLMEGNRCYKVWVDYFHGNSTHGTYLRNFLEGRGFDLSSYQRWFNMVGNVIDVSTTYKSIGSTGNLNRFNDIAFRLGYPGNLGGSPDTGVADDDLVSTTAMIWGNYWDGGGAVFDSGEVPSGDALFPNPVPSSEDLPASFYRSTMPGFFVVSGIGTVAWPPSGPDVSGGTYLGGRAYKLPCQLVYEEASGNPADFDASLYGS